MQNDPSYRHPDAVTDAALDWFLRAREEDGEEFHAALAEWRAADPAHARAYAGLEATWGAGTLRTASRPPTRARRPRHWLAVAAVAALAAFAVLEGPALWLRHSADYLTEAGELRDLRLPDGTAVTLNTASAIAIDFSGGRRHVDLLAGEAFFDVARDAAHPFTVAGRFGEVRVTGTAFSVHRAPDGDRVLLRQGHVQLHHRDGAALPLDPGEGAVIAAAGLQAEGPRDMEAGLAWLRGRIEIEDRPLAAALAAVARYSPARVVLMPGARDLRVSGSFRTADPQAALRSLAETAGLSLHRLPGGTIILY